MLRRAALARRLLQAFVPIFALAALAPSAAAEIKPRLLLARLRPHSWHPRAKRITRRLLDDPQLARKILARGAFVKRGGRYLVKVKLRRKVNEPATLFRVRIKLAGHPEVEAFFKPRQQGYRDWATEVAACRLARHLGVKVAPCFERSVPREVLERALRRVPTAYRQRLQWEAGGRRIFGFFRLWAPRFIDQLGQHRSSRELLLSLARMLRSRYRARVLAHAVLRQLPDLLLFDFLIYNNDRRRNLGVLRTGKRALRLYPIDFGDGFSVSPRRKWLCRAALRRTRLFRRELVRRIRRLDRAAVRRLLRHGKGLLVEPYHVKWVLQQRQALLDHVKKVVARDGPRALF